MKKCLFILLFLSSAFYGNAQKIHFTDTSNTWKVHFMDPNGPIGWEIFRYKADTIWHGTTYRRLIYNEGTFIREDTTAGKVYYITPATDTEEQLLYDYTLQVGDTFACSKAVHRVTLIDSVALNGIWHKIWHMNIDTCFGTPSFLCYNYKVIEGIGSITEPLGPIDPTYFEIASTLTCFTNHGSPPTFSKKVGYYLDNNLSCDPEFLAINPLLRKTDDIYVFPNPVKDMLTIITGEKINNISISNVTGQVVYRNSVNAFEARIEMSRFPPGVYVLCLNNIVYRRIVKE